MFLRVTVDEFRMMFGKEMLAYWREEALPAYLSKVERWKAEEMWPALPTNVSLPACVSWPMRTPATGSPAS
jgi:hypothetical protein